jgi:hypothetical protein
MAVTVNLRCEIGRLSRIVRVGGTRSDNVAPSKIRQGYLAHKKQPPPRTLQKDCVWGPMVAPGRGGVSYERGTPVAGFGVWGRGVQAGAACLQRARI